VFLNYDSSKNPTVPPQQLDTTYEVIESAVEMFSLLALQ